MKNIFIDEIDGQDGEIITIAEMLTEEHSNLINEIQNIWDYGGKVPDDDEGFQQCFTQTLYAIKNHHRGIVENIGSILDNK